jgi:hypothetical protein
MKRNKAMIVLKNKIGVQFLKERRDRAISVNRRKETTRKEHKNDCIERYDYNSRKQIENTGDIRIRAKKEDEGKSSNDRIE